jgi:hypothetical protein
MPTSIVADIQPSTALRSRPSFVTAVVSARAAGMAHAAPRPARARPAISGSAARERPASSEPAAKAQPGNEQTAPPQQVPGTPAHQQEGAERQRVGSDDPLELGAPKADVLADLRERHADDDPVEHHEHLGGEEDGEHEAAARHAGPIPG